MKNLVRLLMTMFLFAGITSCEEELDRTTFNGVGTFLSFASSNPNSIPVNVGETTSVDIEINTSTLSNTDRTYTIIVDTDPEVTTANPSNYSLPTSVTIPGGSYIGTLTMVVTDDDNLDSTPRNVVFSLGGVDNVNMDSNIASISIFEVCPVPTTFFTGDYLIEQITAELDGPTLSAGTVVEVIVDENNELNRIFETQNYPSFCSSFVPFTVGLICNELVVPLQDNICACGDGTDWFGPLPQGSNGTFSVAIGDDVLEVSFQDDIQGDCAPVATTTYRFTKQ